MVYFQLPLPGLARNFNELPKQEKAFIAYFSVIDMDAISPVVECYAGIGPKGYNVFLILVRIIKIKERILSDRQLSEVLKKNDLYRFVTKDIRPLYRLGHRISMIWIRHGPVSNTPVGESQLMGKWRPRTRALYAATIQLARVADAEAHIAAENIASRHHGGRSEASMDYRVVPSVLFTYPQYAMVGKTEQALKDEAVVYEKSFAKESWAGRPTNAWACDLPPTNCSSISMDRYWVHMSYPTTPPA